jgi:poly(3-hydroxybutyrate) depolymerase
MISCRGGSTYTNTRTIDVSQIPANTAPAAIFSTERYGAMTYTIPNRSGAQTVTLYFAETYVTAAGQRVFNVSVNGAAALSNFDIFASAGGADRAIARSFNTTANSSGQVVIQFTAVTENPKINGITVAGGIGDFQTLTVTKSGTGTVTSNPAGINCGSTCSASFATNASVTLTASGGTFTGWGGACSGTSTTCTVSMSQARSVTATFSGGGDTRPSAGCGKNRTLQNGTITISSGGVNRTYILRTPDNYNNTRPYRLIVAYHWLNGSAQNVASENYYRLFPLSNNSTIFLAPQGLDAGWANTNNRDLNLTDAILTQVQNDLCIDLNRIWATGFSYGAGMSYAIACARANVFRGVALYAGAQLSGCTGGTTAIAYFATHGINDSVLNISQGRTLRNRFVTNNSCTAQNPPEPSSGSGTHICTSYQNCSAGHPVRWCAFDGDHTPNQTDRGQSTSWIPGEVWNFISSVDGGQ